MEDPRIVQNTMEFRFLLFSMGTHTFAFSKGMMQKGCHMKINCKQKKTPGIQCPESIFNSLIVQMKVFG